MVLLPFCACWSGSQRLCRLTYIHVNKTTSSMICHKTDSPESGHLSIVLGSVQNTGVKASSTASTLAAVKKDTACLQNSDRMRRRKWAKRRLDLTGVAYRKSWRARRDLNPQPSDPKIDIFHTHMILAANLARKY